MRILSRYVHTTAECFSLKAEGPLTRCVSAVIMSCSGTYAERDARPNVGLLVLAVVAGERFWLPRSREKNESIFKYDMKTNGSKASIGTKTGDQKGRVFSGKGRSGRARPYKRTTHVSHFCFQPALGSTTHRLATLSAVSRASSYNVVRAVHGKMEITHARVVQQ